jgi:xanthine dehydrogenase accessory factor
MNYHVIICDPRESDIDKFVFDGCEIVNSMPDDAVQTWANHTRCIVVALTHDPKLDDMALFDALSSPAFYVGAIGSRRNCEKRRERLKTLGVTAQQLQGLRAPVGLPIGSHSPPEIAVSIMAEITKLRHQAKQNSQHAINAA